MNTFKNQKSGFAREPEAGEGKCPDWTTERVSDGRYEEDRAAYWKGWMFIESTAQTWENREWIRDIFKDVMAENFPNVLLMKDIDSQIQEAHWWLSLCDVCLAVHTCTHFLIFNLKNCKQSTLEKTEKTHRKQCSWKWCDWYSGRGNPMPMTHSIISIQNTPSFIEQ